MDAVRVLLAGESWVSNSTHYKGWDFFSSTVYETGIKELQAALALPPGWPSPTCPLTWRTSSSPPAWRRSGHMTSSC